MDGYDETIVPVDHKMAGEIVDDEMNAILVRQLPRGVRLTAIFDSCHSQTALDLPFIYDCDGNIKKQKDNMYEGYTLNSSHISLGTSGELNTSIDCVHMLPY